jgi:hypothetical protein
MQKSVLAALFFWVTPTAASENYTVQSLLMKCSGRVGSLDSIFCVARVGGIADALGFNGYLVSHGAVGLEKFATYASKPVPTYGADIQVFKNWAEKHPERWGDTDMVGVATALQETWPCEND